MPQYVAFDYFGIEYEKQSMPKVTAPAAVV